MTFKNMAPIGIALAILAATSSPSLAGESRFSSTWTPDAKADLVKMLHLHQWDDEVITRSLDRFAYYLGLGHAPSGQEMVVEGVRGDTIAVALDPSGIRGMPGCEIGSMTMKNPLRSKTTVSGVFCPSGSSWRYAPHFLEITEMDANNRTLRTTDVTDIGKKRPK
ncbi:hypothetical protein GCM10011611_03110 [Aliidongia dinghuensis]|uniref:Uncharacterized protein n=1 Tax=Aliidongia dinghuensis TaxID=1867774 RepID=A0A8J3E1H3_9PROT|nr:hypothetical protein [Aliidongia dinghuensis]GGF00901.1 hypothetical protein GCM10011611_03110 [Aliidongia dinghuensis]